MTAYWIERFPPRVFGPAAAVIAVAGQPFATFDPRQWAGATLTALLLLAQFRLWDDLADRERDRQTAPERVLVRVSSIGPFVAVCVALALINLLLAALSGGVTGVAGCLLLNAAAAAWYAWRPARCTVAADLVLLVKYPWFVIVIAAGSGAPFAQIAVAAPAIYAAACAFEYLSSVASASWRKDACSARRVCKFSGSRSLPPNLSAVALAKAEGGRPRRDPLRFNNS